MTRKKVEREAQAAAESKDALIEELRRELDERRDEIEILERLIVQMLMERYGMGRM